MLKDKYFLSNLTNSIICEVLTIPMIHDHGCQRNTQQNMPHSVFDSFVGLQHLMELYWNRLVCLYYFVHIFNVREKLKALHAMKMQ